MSVTVDVNWVASQIGCFVLLGVPVLIAILLATKYRVIERGTKEEQYYDD